MGFADKLKVKSEHPLTLFAAIFLTGLQAVAGPDSFTYEGYLTDSLNRPIQEPAPGLPMTFKIIGRSGSDDCELATETRDVPVDNGSFTARIGSPGATSSIVHEGVALKIADVFTGAVTSGRYLSNGDPGCAFDPAGAAARWLLQVTIDGAEFQATVMSSAPMAITANRVGRSAESDLLRIKGQNAELSSTQWTSLLDIVDGTGGTYAKSADLPAFVTSPPVCSTGQVLKSDGTNFICVTDETGDAPGPATTASTGVVRVGSGLEVDGAGLLRLQGATSASAGQVLRSTGSAYVPQFLSLADIRSSAIPANTIFPSTACNANETLNWSSLTDAFTCRAISLPRTQVTGLLWQDQGSGNISYGPGKVGIGTTAPGATLEVAGQVKITGGAPGAGKVLTSDAGGLASWMPFSIANGSINTAHLADGSVTDVKIVDMAASKLTGSLDAARLPSSVILNGGNMGAITVGTNNAADLVFETAGAPRLTVFSGGDIATNGNLTTSGNIKAGAKTQSTAISSIFNADFSNANTIRATATGSCGTINVTGIPIGSFVTLTMANATSVCAIQHESSPTAVKLPAGYASGDPVGGQIYSFLFDGTILWVSHVPY